MRLMFTNSQRNLYDWLVILTSIYGRIESRGNSHMTRTMRRRAVPDTKPWHCEPSPRTTSYARRNSSSLRVAFSATCTSLLSEPSTTNHFLLILSCSYKVHRSSNKIRIIPRTVAMTKVLKTFSRSIFRKKTGLIFLCIL